ncbi:MAG: peptide deformylase [Deltaproteobacteria bacterium]|nr:peptide deformylase [Deltaproteobacteria bacterium]
MAILTVRTVPEPILRRRSKRVRNIDGSIRKLAADMIEAMHAASGAGLAAPQVGVPLRVIVVGMPGEEDIVLINPQIVRRAGERWVTEGCLSVPGYFGEIQRAQWVTVKGKDLSGKEIRIKAEELLAQALEHEIDHINGVLYIDHLESKDRLHKVEPEVTPL